MPKISGEILINQSVELVFDYVADQRNEPTNNPQMLHSEKITEGPIGVGTRFRATAQSGRREIKMLIEVTESVESSVNRQRNRRYPRRVRKPFPYMAVERLHPIRPKAVMAVMAVGPLRV